MKHYLKRTPLFMAVFGILILASCKSDSEPEAPTISLSTTSVEGQAGETISAVVTYTAPEGFESLTVEKNLNGEAVESEVITTDGSGSYNFEYEILIEDSEGILSFTFTVTDKSGLTASADLVVGVELSNEQLLVKYDWLLSEEIRHATGENDISDAYTDDVYRFHADGTYDKSIGEKADDFGDLWYNYCYWNLSENNVLIMTRTGAFGEDVRDTLRLTEINVDEFRADITYRGLDVFNTGEEDVPYESEEEYTKVYVSQPKGDSFDPYGPGSEDDAGPAGMCIEVEF